MLNLSTNADVKTTMMVRPIQGNIVDRQSIIKMQIFCFFGEIITIIITRIMSPEPYLLEYDDYLSPIRSSCYNTIVLATCNGTTRYEQKRKEKIIYNSAFQRMNTLML